MVSFLKVLWCFICVFLVILCLLMFVEWFVFWLFREVLRDVCWVLRNRCTTSMASGCRKQKILCKPAPAYAENELPEKLHIQNFTFIFGINFLWYFGIYFNMIPGMFSCGHCQGFLLDRGVKVLTFTLSVRLRVNCIYLFLHKLSTGFSTD